VLDGQFSHSVACEFCSMYLREYGDAEGAAKVAALMAAAAATAVTEAVGGQQQQLPVPRQLDFERSSSAEVSVHLNLGVWVGQHVFAGLLCRVWHALCAKVVAPLSKCTLLDHRALVMYAKHAAAANDILQRVSQCQRMRTQPCYCLLLQCTTCLARVAECLLISLC
jgi:hypothetical protein